MLPLSGDWHRHPWAAGIRASNRSSAIPRNDLPQNFAHLVDLTSPVDEGRWNRAVAPRLDEGDNGPRAESDSVTAHREALRACIALA
jgi:hypothetical protein